MDGGPAVDLLLRHGRVLTLDPARRILVDGSIAVRDGRIVAIGPDREVEPTVRASTARDLGGAVVHPGLIDAHVHPNSETIRGFAPRADRDWDAIEGRSYATKTAANDRIATMLSCMEMVANGTTCYADTGGSLFLEPTIAATELVGMRGLPGAFIADQGMPPALGMLQHTTDDCMAMLRDQVERHPFASDARVRCAVSLSGMGQASDALLLAARDLAAERRAPMVMHQSWGAWEVDAHLERYGRRPIEHLADIGVLGPNLTLIHMIQLSDDEVELIARSGTRVVHCPAAALRRAVGAFRVGKFPELLAAGATVGLGTDGLGGKRDLFRQAYLTTVVHREVRNAYPVLTSERALEMATLDGARALNLDHEIGSLEVGKRADIVVHSTTRPELHPAWADPTDQLILYSGASAVATVYVDGEAIFDDGRYSRFDAVATLRELDAESRAFEAHFGRSAFSIWPLVD